VLSILERHLWHLGCTWTTCTPSLLSRMYGGCLRAVPGVLDAFCTSVHRPLCLGRVLHVCTPFLVSWKGLTRLHAVPGVLDTFGTPLLASWTYLEHLHTVLGIPDPLRMLERRLRQLRRICTTVPGVLEGFDTSARRP
jgi:hypothetical protein